MRDRRKDIRVEWNSLGRFFNDGSRYGRPCVVSNLSSGGAKIVLAANAVITDTFRLRITPHSPLRECMIAWRKGYAVGVEFVQQVEQVQPVRGQRYREATFRTSLGAMHTESALIG